MSKFIWDAIFHAALSAVISLFVWFIGEVVIGQEVSFLLWWKWTFIILMILENWKVIWMLGYPFAYPIGMLGWTLGKRSRGYTQAGNCIQQELHHEKPRQN